MPNSRTENQRYTVDTIARLVATAILCLSMPGVAMGQSTVLAGSDAGSEFERYVRVLQLAGLATPTQVSLRPFQVTQLRRITLSAEHPWRGMLSGTRPMDGIHVLAPTTTAVINSSLPFGFND